MNKNSKQHRIQKIKAFNPNENGLKHHGIFGLPFDTDEAQLVLLPVPWEVTVSYGEGTARGPEAILKASQQIDLYDPIFPDGWKAGMAMDEISAEWKEAGAALRAQSGLYFQEYGEDEISPSGLQFLKEANQACDNLRNWVKNHTRQLLGNNKVVGIVGGEHSVPLGFIEALAEKHDSFGILQIDAHADLRKAYEGFVHSHASIMYNATQLSQVEKLIQVGIRDFSAEENEYTIQNAGRIIMITDYQLKASRFDGLNWAQQCTEIVDQLPQSVYISFDIDGLQPWLCPNTGTPVPGGLELEEAIYLIEKVVESGRTIIGFDLCEVSPGEDEWDGNVGSRVLYKLCLLAAKSNNIEV